MAIHCAAANRGGLIKKEKKRKKVHGLNLRPSTYYVGWPNNNKRVETFQMTSRI